MARVWLAQVEDGDPVAFGQAVADGLAFVGDPGHGARKVVAASGEGASKQDRAAAASVVRVLSERGRDASLLRGLPRGAGTTRYQLSVAAPGERLEAHEDLFGAPSLVWCSRLRWCPELDGVGGALDAAARALLPVPLDALPAGERLAALGGLVEVADPDVCVGDGRSVALGAGVGAESSHRLGLVLVADSALAHDVVWAAVLGRSDVAWIEHLASMGLGPGALESIDLGGDELELFARRLAGFGPRAPSLPEVAMRFQQSLGVALPVEVLADGDTPAARRAHAWLCAHTEHPHRREVLKNCPPFTLLAGARAPGALPGHDRVLALGPSAVDGMLADVRVSSAHRRPVSLAIVRGSSAVLWDLTMTDGRRIALAALPDPVPSVARIGRAAAVLTGWRSLRHPRESRASAIAGWILRRLRRTGVPAPLVHARRISRLQSRPWRQAHLLGPPLREDADG